MALPTDRQSHINYCLKRLGAPVNNIEVAPEQLDDRIDESLQYWTEYHYNAQVKVFLKHQMTADEIKSHSIKMPDNVKHITQVYVTDFGVSTGIFSLRYQLSLNDLYDLSSTTLSNYVVAMQYVDTIKDVLIPESSIRFQEHMGLLIFDSDLAFNYVTGQYVIIECYITIDPETYPKVWSDRVLLDLSTAIIKRQWGENLKKFGNLQLPGGTTVNGQIIFDEATAEIEAMKNTFINMYQDADLFFVA